MEYVTAHFLNGKVIGEWLSRISEYLRSKAEGEWHKIIWDSDRSVLYTVRDSYRIGGFAYHRLDGPSLIIGGVVTFIIDDRQYWSTKQYCKDAGMSGEDTLMWVLRFGDDLPKTCEEYYGVGWESIPLDQL